MLIFNLCQTTLKSNIMLKIVRIPYDGSPSTAEAVALTEIGPGGTSLDECIEQEKWLTCFPKIKESQAFSWKHRSLVGVTAENLGRSSGDWKADYLMYTCQDKQAGMCISPAFLPISGSSASCETFPLGKRHQEPLQAILLHTRHCFDSTNY